MSLVDHETSGPDHCLGTPAAEGDFGIKESTPGTSFEGEDKEVGDRACKL